MISKSTIDKVLININKLNILVIGDIMLDKYIWGDINRISQEAPIPIIDIISTSYNIGGAGNVVSNLAGLGVNVSIASILGIDEEAKIISNSLNKMNVDDSMILNLSNRPTTLKTRYLSQSQQVIRIDREESRELNLEYKLKLYDLIKKNIDKFDGVLIQSYDKGVLDKWLIKKIIKISQLKSIPIYVDPKKKNFFDFLNVNLFKPNLNEVSRALNVNITNNNIEKIGLDFKKKINCKNLLITQGKDGMSLFNDTGYHQIQTKAKSVHDVSGAGDTVISVFTATHLCGANSIQATELSNFAAGKVCEHIGVYPIKVQDIKDYFKRIEI